MDVKEKIQELFEKISEDKELQEQFMKDPVKAIEKLTGLDLPDDMLDKVIDGVKAKLTVDKVSDIADGLKKLF